MRVFAVDTWLAGGWVVISGLMGWLAHDIYAEAVDKRRARKHRCATLDAYWSHEITAQETARRLAAPEAKR